MLGNLNALFGNVTQFKDDAIAYTMIAAGAIVAPTAYNYLFETAATALKLDRAGGIYKYAKPVGALVVGILGGRYLSRYNRNLGMGVAVGCTAMALSQALTAVAPSVAAKVFTGMPMAQLPAPSTAVAGLGYGSVEVEEVNGAPISIENVGGFGANFAAALT